MSFASLGKDAKMSSNVLGGLNKGDVLDAHGKAFLEHLKAERKKAKAKRPPRGIRAAEQEKWKLCPKVARKIRAKEGQEVRTHFKIMIGMHCVFILLELFFYNLMLTIGSFFIIKVMLKPYKTLEISCT